MSSVAVAPHRPADNPFASHRIDGLAFRFNGPGLAALHQRLEELLEAGREHRRILRRQFLDKISEQRVVRPALDQGRQRSRAVEGGYETPRVSCRT